MCNNYLRLIEISHNIQPYFFCTYISFTNLLQFLFIVIIVFQAKYKGPWITHPTPYGRCVYLNLETLDYSWECPTYFSTPKYLNMEEIQASLNKTFLNKIIIL